MQTPGYEGSHPPFEPPPLPGFLGVAFTVTARVVALARPAAFEAITRHARCLPASLLASLMRLRCVDAATPFLSHVYRKLCGDQRQPPVVHESVDPTRGLPVMRGRDRSTGLTQNRRLADRALAAPPAGL